MRLAFFLALAAALAACAPAQQTAPPTLTWGSSFGMCVGYCTAELVVTPDRIATLTRSAPRSGEPTLTLRRTIGIAEYADLVAAYDRDALAAADSVYGCPDCADGGAEFVSDGAHRVAFEFGADVPGLMPLVAALREIHAAFPPPPGRGGE